MSHVHSYPFPTVETCVSKPKQYPLPVVLFPKKGANKYSPHVYSLSATLQQSHLLVLEVQDLTSNMRVFTYKNDEVI